MVMVLYNRLERAAYYLYSSVLPCQRTTQYHGRPTVTAMLLLMMTVLLILYLLFPLQSHFSWQSSPVLHDEKPNNKKSPQQTGSKLIRNKSSNPHPSPHGHGDDNGSTMDAAVAFQAPDGGGNEHHHNDDVDGQPVLYSRARPDRSGAAIQDMLFAHAFAFSENVTYGGACDADVQTQLQQQQQQKKNMINKDGEGDTLNLSPEQILEHRKDQQNVIQMLGLQDTLPFACPKDDQRGGIIMNRLDYYHQDTKIWSREWVKHIQSMVTFDYNPTPRRTAVLLQVAVHVRRGDVTPCTHASRYLPNSYYLNVLDTYLPQNKAAYEVSIYSNAGENDDHSFEGWEPFVKRNYSLNLQTNALDVWKALISADIFIMSKSSMSLVTAMLNTNRKNASTIIYTPFWHQPLDEWIVVQNNLLKAIQPEVERLAQLAGGCPS